jgi:hypothetical protein
MPPLPPESLAELAAAAMAAPSADNRHLFRIEQREARIDLVATDELMGAGARRHRLALLSLGAVAENMVLRASRLGFGMAAEVAARPFADHRLVTFSWAEQQPRASALEAAIGARHSNRRLRFAGPPLAPEIRAAMDGCAAGLPGVRLAWLDGRPERRAAVRGAWAAEAARFRSEELHAELYEAVRLDVGWRGSAEVGIPPSALELAPFERAPFAALKSWRLQKLANVLGTHRFMALRSVALPAWLSAHLCAVVSDQDSPDAPFYAGRLLQRVWLHATSAGVSLQVFAAMPLFLAPGLAPISENVRAVLAECARAAMPGGVPQILFRMGHAPAPTAIAGRPPAAGLLAR